MIFIDGSEQDLVRTTDFGVTNLIQNDGNFTLGTTGANSVYGWIDEFHVQNGLARWTSDFTPSTSPYGLTATFPDIGSGQVNTDYIIAQPGATDSGAEECDDYYTVSTTTTGEISEYTGNASGEPVFSYDDGVIVDKVNFDINQMMFEDNVLISREVRIDGFAYVRSAGYLSVDNTPYDPSGDIPTEAGYTVYATTDENGMARVDYMFPVTYSSSFDVDLTVDIPSMSGENNGSGIVSETSLTLLSDGDTNPLYNDRNYDEFYSEMTLIGGEAYPYGQSGSIGIIATDTALSVPSTMESPSSIKIATLESYVYSLYTDQDATYIPPYTLTIIDPTNLIENSSFETLPTSINLILNGSFETGVSSWTVYGGEEGKAKFTQSSDKSTLGTYSAKLFKTRYGGYPKSATIPVSAGTQYDFSIKVNWYYYNAPVSPSVIISAGIYNAADNTLIGESTLGPNPVKYVWHTLSNTITVPSECTEVYMKLDCIDSNGGLNNYTVSHWDDVSVTEITETVGIFESPDPDNMVMLLSQQYPKHGTHSLHTYHDSGSYYYVESESITVTQGTEYTFSAWVYSEGAEEGVWYLPSIDELDLMYVNLHASAIGDFSDTYYWSSSEETIVTAYGVDFNTGMEFTQTKSTTGYNVRPVREFTSQTNYDIGGSGELGYVFSKSDSSPWSYIEAYTHDINMSSIPWSDASAPSSIATLETLGSGSYNTSTIIAQDNHTSSAALFATFAGSDISGEVTRYIKRAEIYDGDNNRLGQVYCSYGGYNRMTKTFISSYSSDSVRIRLHPEDSGSQEAWWDAIVLEPGAIATAYTEGESINLEYYLNDGIVDDLNSVKYLVRYIGGNRITKEDQRDIYDV
jgi:hypothetical protein